jgi:hypothetical protein
MGPPKTQIEGNRELENLARDDDMSKASIKM